MEDAEAKGRVSEHPVSLPILQVRKLRLGGGICLPRVKQWRPWVRIFRKATLNQTFDKTIVIIISPRSFIHWYFQFCGKQCHQSFGKEAFLQYHNRGKSMTGQSHFTFPSMTWNLVSNLVSRGSQIWKTKKNHQKNLWTLMWHLLSPGNRHCA